MRYSVNVMRRLGVLLIALLGAVGIGGWMAAAQEPVVRVTEPVPGFDSIVHDPVAYRRILDKFTAGVVRPSYEECVIAYYGFALQEPYRSGDGGSGGAIESEAEMQRAIMAEDYETAYLLGCQVLERNPVNLTALYWTLHAATGIKQPWEVRNSLRGRYNGIAYVISRSGDGIAPETALRVICLGDMYTYLATELELGLASSERRLWDDRWMEFEVRPSAKFRYSSIFFELWPGQ